MKAFKGPAVDFIEAFEVAPGPGRGEAVSAIASKGTATVEDVPTDLTAVEDTPSPIDFSGMKIKTKGGVVKEVTLELSASAGTFDVASDSKIEVFDSGTGTVRLVGKTAHRKTYLDNASSVTFTGARNDFGEVEIAISVIDEGVTTTETSTSITIEELPDVLTGTPNPDTLTGDEGRDIISGLGDNDMLSGNGGADTITGGDGKDTILGGAGADDLDGGADEDVLQYFGSSAGVQIDLNLNGSGLQQASGGDAEGDVIQNFEHVYGSDFADVITGDAGRNILFGYDGADSISGGAGDDVIRGGEGADTMDGGDGIDWLRYLESSDGVTVDLSLALQVSAGDADGDLISGYENVQGSDLSDVISGDDGANYILGFDGDDVISGGGGRDSIRGGAGADEMHGGDDVDTLQYNGSTAGIIIDLNADESGLQSASGGDAEGDIISGFEIVLATDFDDVITGDAGRNILYGYDGDDILNGGDAKDALRGGAGADQFVFDTALADSNVDRILDFEAGLDMLILAGDIFVGLAYGVLSADAFHLAAGGLAANAGHRIIYDSDTGDLYFDADGTGAAEAQHFAILTTTPLMDGTDVFIF